jgi:hypothetical protein
VLQLVVEPNDRCISPNIHAHQRVYSPGSGESAPLHFTQIQPAVIEKILPKLVASFDERFAQGVQNLGYHLTVDEDDISRIEGVDPSIREKIMAPESVIARWVETKAKIKLEKDPSLSPDAVRVYYDDMCRRQFKSDSRYPPG